MNQILWECNTLECCEAFPQGIPQIPGHNTSRFKGLEPESDGPAVIEAALKSFHDGENLSKEASDGTVHAISGKTDQEPTQTTDMRIDSQVVQPSQDGHETGLEGYYLWSRLLEKYCKTKLTAGSDKLVAMAGLVKHFQAFLDDDCISGLWRSILPSQLLWMVDDGEEIATFVHPDIVKKELERGMGDDTMVINATRPAAWRAPTWSWASIDGSISAPPPSRGPAAIFIGGVIAPDEERPPADAPENANVNVSATGLVVHGCLHSAKLFYNLGNLSWAVAVRPEGMCVQKPAGGEYDNTEISTEALSDHDMSSPEGLGIGLAYPDINLDIRTFYNVLCLPVRRSYRRKALRRDQLSTDTPNFAGLLLLPQDEGTPGAYQRIGCFHLIDEQGFGKKLSTNEKYKHLFAFDEYIVLV
jgi:hypothetical protein